MTLTPRARKTKKGFSIYIDKYVNGERAYETIFQNVSKKEKNSKLVEAENLIEERNQNSKLLSVYQFFKKYVDSYQKRDLRVIKAVIRKFEEFNGDDIQPNEISENILDEFRYFLLKNANLNGETSSSYSVRFKKILRYMYNDKIISREILDSFKIISEFNNKPKDILTMVELKSLRNHKVNNEQVKLAFMFCCLSGLGYAEVKKLNWKHIQGRNLKIKREKTSNYIDIELSDLALELLGSRKNEGLVFNLVNVKTGKFFSSATINLMLNIWMKDLCIDKSITFYCARHSFANFLFEKSYNSKNYNGLFYVVSQAMGHSSQKSTYRYLNNYRNDVYSLTNNLGVC